MKRQRKLTKKEINEIIFQQTKSFNQIIGQVPHFKITSIMVKHLGFGPATLLSRMIFKWHYWAKRKRLDGGWFFYRREDMAHDLKTHPITISRWIKQLENAKFNDESILITSRKGHKNRNNYTISLNALAGLHELHEKEAKRLDRNGEEKCKN